MSWFPTRIFPDEDDPSLSAEQRAFRDRERRHFVFAAVLILGCMLSLPLAGLAYFLLMKLGYVPWPF